MKNFNHLKHYIKNVIDEKRYAEVNIDGTTYKEISVDYDVNNYCEIIEDHDRIRIDCDNLIIDGMGHTINLNHHSAAFSVSSENVILKNFNFRNGYGGGKGGVIFNEGMLKVENCTFTHSKAETGGAICNKGTLIVEDSCFEGNKTSDYWYGYGSAIYNEGILIIKDTRFTNNESSHNQELIFNKRSFLIMDCLFENDYCIRTEPHVCYDAETISQLTGETVKNKETLKNCVFRNGKNLISSRLSAMDIINCVFTDNYTLIIGDMSTMNIRDCFFEKNHGIIISDREARRSPININNCRFVDNESKRHSFYIKNRLNIKNSQIKNNSSKYLFECISSNVRLDSVLFEDNDCESIFNYSTLSYDRENEILKLNNVLFKEKMENVISCEGNLEITDCKFQKHHKINGENVFDIYKSEKKFMKTLNEN